MERRLTTILAADVVGYSRMMGADEAGTLAALKAYRKDIIDPNVAQYNGRIVKLMGDGALMEFTSVVDAVGFAVEVQNAVRARNVDIEPDKRVVYRIGINIGDIIVDGDDIYGDGVNIAARLEGLAEPGFYIPFSGRSDCRQARYSSGRSGRSRGEEYPPSCACVPHALRWCQAGKVFPQDNSSG
jgi:class 3 adenylate cyclase